MLFGFSGRRLVLAAAGTDSTMTLGDGSDRDGFITSTEFDLEAGAIGNIVDGKGAYLAFSGGKLYTADDKIDADYIASGTPGAVTPVTIFAIATTREWAP